MRALRVGLFAFAIGALLACGSGCGGAATGDAKTAFRIQTVAQFNQPWAMCFLPDGRLLVSEKPGALKLVTADGRVRREVDGVPAVAYGGQGGLGDVILHPEFPSNALVYLSYAEAGAGGLRGAAVARARLVMAPEPQLQDLRVIWRQTPKVTGCGHYGHRLTFGPDGYLYVTSGDRQKLAPAQDLAQNLGKLVRLHDDGRPVADNPFVARGGAAAQIWSYGHRNPLGIAFDARQRLWMHEMGPQGGDELNLIVRGGNYGWPLVSEGEHYSGEDIPQHVTRPDLRAPQLSWTPVIAPAGFIIYDGALFPKFRGSGFIGGLRSQAMVRVVFDGERAREAERWDMGQRIREVEQGPDGAIWLLEDGQAPTGGRLQRLTPPG